MTWQDLERELDRLDRSASHGPWTREVLGAIERAPGHPRCEAGRAVRPRSVIPFKRDVRKLKELGLTESLEIGYRLSPRGRAILPRLVDGGGA